MKINADVYPVKQLKTEKDSPNKNPKTAKASNKQDSIVLSDNKLLNVREENMSASKTEFSDFKRAEEEIFNLKNIIGKDTCAASKIHQINGQRVLYLALD